MVENLKIVQYILLWACRRVTASLNKVYEIHIYTAPLLTLPLSTSLPLLCPCCCCCCCWWSILNFMWHSFSAHCKPKNWNSDRCETKQKKNNSLWCMGTFWISRRPLAYTYRRATKRQNRIARPFVATVCIPSRPAEPYRSNIIDTMKTKFGIFEHCCCSFACCCPQD